MADLQPTLVEVLVLGAGGAGLFCATFAAARGRKVCVIDHAKKAGGKILISGGGRCNFTNIGAGPGNYVSKNPHFAKSALSRFPPSKFIEIVDRHGLAYHEKKLGQLFCDQSAADLVKILIAEFEESGAKLMLETSFSKVSRLAASDAPLRFEVQTSKGAIRCESLVVATGGLSIPKIGATGIGYQLASQFGLELIERAPALDGFTLSRDRHAHWLDLSGLSVDVVLSCNGMKFRENILFTHSGISGPASLQGSLHWYPGDPIHLDFLPDGGDLMSFFKAEKLAGNRSTVKNLLAQKIPARLASVLCQEGFPEESPLPQVSEKKLEAFCTRIRNWEIIPSGTVGYSKAEVTRGGVSTDELSSKTLESKKVPGLYFIGEVVDVTGWLGGYNYQWAWASAWAAAQVV
ncbi:MAG: NAD(P)/FAD-dependent oxidoreductase [Bdellovibrionales bacterium]|nr:NAD(P)/FAD-dependent oxidoreductase [Bdellovibrionales bacterium]